MNLVLDASAAIPAALSREPSDVLVLIDVYSHVMAPDLFVAEVCSGLWKHVIAGQITSDVAVLRLNRALSFVDQRVPVVDLAEEALREAAARRHSVYDMFYIVLARREQATLLTLDNRMRMLAQAMNVPTV